MTSVLGIDVGTVRMGVAASDPTGIIATPLTVLRRSDGDAMWHALQTTITEREVDRVVIGLPRRLDGSEGDSAEMARSFGDELHARTGLVIEWWDERFTTQAAERSLIAAGVRRAKRREKIDAVAATLMLQSWLDAQRGRKPT